MLMPASSEFIALCQAQVALLTDGLGAALSIVYLTEELTEVSDAKLVPIAAYPEAVSEWEDDRIFTLLSQRRRGSGSTQRLLGSDGSHGTDDFESEHSLSAASLSAHSSAHSKGVDDVHPLQSAETALLRQQQIVLPLIYQDVVMGLLVTARADRAWTNFERTQIEKIAETLAISCILDQRSQWVAQDLHQQRSLREQRHELLDDLLHQFRNPLTALRTFGKLLVKRLNPSDANRTVAEGIVRESDRLQELLQQFNAAIDIDDAEFRRLLTQGEEIQDGELADEENQVQNSGVGNQAMRPVDPATPALPETPTPLLPGTTLLVGSPLQRSPQAITKVLFPLLDSARAIAQDRQLTLHCEVPEHLPLVNIDSRALREVLNNLIDNALKYTPAGGQIYIRVQSQPFPAQTPLLGHEHQQAIVVADTGPGIPLEDLNHLFERHYRGVQAMTDIPGTGLGLAIARELVHQMRGEIQVFSPAHTCGMLPKWDECSPSPGTAIVVWLPEVG
jgi:signal transduction histidine kinase